MTLTVGPERPDQPEVLAFLDAGEQHAAELVPPESNHHVDLRALLDRRVTFLVARYDGIAVGCGAIRREDGYAEIKRMWVDPGSRGAGVGARILAELERIAAAEGVPELRLETGARSRAALALYRGAGFVETGPFGAHREDPNRVFMAKRPTP